jgi:hypothetical protein
MFDYFFDDHFGLIIGNDRYEADGPGFESR